MTQEDDREFMAKDAADAFEAAVEMLLGMALSGGRPGAWDAGAMLRAEVALRFILREGLTEEEIDRYRAQPR